MLDTGAMKIEFYSGGVTNNPSRPESKFASLKGEAMGIEHGLTFNSWSLLSLRQQAIETIFKDVEICQCCEDGGTERGDDPAGCRCECHD